MLTQKQYYFAQSNLTGNTRLGILFWNRDRTRSFIEQCIYDREIQAIYKDATGDLRPDASNWFNNEVAHKPDRFSNWQFQAQTVNGPGWNCSTDQPNFCGPEMSIIINQLKQERQQIENEALAEVASRNQQQPNIFVNQQQQRQRPRPAPPTNFELNQIRFNIRNQRVEAERQQRRTEYLTALRNKNRNNYPSV